ncbi:methionine-synthesizing 5- methyltetrahydropteroyltriglutamate--homocysteine methyltransferase [Tulasnella sp. UAMH 9824]|nr:methionine-synthesizing 5- methyltetrahydropteroyltriglutamate--homocysteine methyltransferase [Tulasnella sp. UAMH 9824]
MSNHHPQSLRLNVLDKKLFETIVVPLQGGGSLAFQVRGSAVTQRLVRFVSTMALPVPPTIPDRTIYQLVRYGSGEDFKALEFQGDLWLNYYLGSMVFKILRRMYGQRRWTRTVSGHLSGCVRSNAVFSMLGFRLKLALSPTSKSTADRFEAMVHAIRQDANRSELEPWIEKVFTPLIEEGCLVVAQKLPGKPQRIDLPSSSRVQTTYYEDDDGYIIIDDSSEDETEIIEISHAASRTDEAEVAKMLARDTSSSPPPTPIQELYNYKATVLDVQSGSIGVNVPKLGERSYFKVGLAGCADTVESYKYNAQTNQLDIEWKASWGENEDDDEIQMDGFTSSIAVGSKTRVWVSYHDKKLDRTANTTLVHPWDRRLLVAAEQPSYILGFPRIGPKREIKFAVESYWGGKSSAEDLQKVAAEIRKQSWTNVKDKGVDYIPRQVTPIMLFFVDDAGRPLTFANPPMTQFSLYDHVLDHSTAFNVIPSRYQNLGLSELDVYFAMGRGRQADGVDVPASEMKKWFDSNYHFVVPELSGTTDLKLNYNKPLKHYKEAKEAGINTRPVVLGPVSFLALGKPSRSAEAGFQPISLLPKLLPLRSIELGRKAIDILGEDRVIVATSSSLLHTPVTLASETKLTDEQKDWFSFALEKAGEVATIAAVLSGSQDAEVAKALEANIQSIKKRRDFEKNSDDTVRKRVAAITPDDLNRKSPFPARAKAQEALKLPKFPTTTIGSFPQTKEIRQARLKLGKKELTQEEYDKFIEKEIQEVVKFQEEVGLDLLVHGEPERNDMVQYFGELLNGFVFTQHGWVQSYGSRYVRPPIVVSDVSRSGPMTVKWSSYAQSITDKPMKGMLTGPVTILNWSFPRIDVSREIQSKQLALALRDEVIDLEAANIKAIQVDEPAIREGLPLRRKDWDAYLTWAVDSFRLATAGVGDHTQTHSHFCYSDFNDIFPSIQRLDADVISIEASKSDMKLLSAFQEFGYKNYIGPGVYDIHSPRVPSEQEIKDRIKDMLTLIKPDYLFVNPDCGLKTRQWKETKVGM